MCVNNDPKDADGWQLQANGLAPNWGQSIFQTANEIAANTMYQTKIEEIQAKTDAEKEWWEKRRSAISSEFMKELDEDAAATTQPKAPSSEDGILVDVGSPGGDSGASKKKKGKK